MDRSRIFRTGLAAATAAAGLWLGITLVLPATLPFWIGLLIARIARRPAAFLADRCHLPRRLASGLSVFCLFCAMGAGVYWICRAACGELEHVSRELPSLLSSLSAPVGRLRRWLFRAAGQVPGFAGDMLQQSVDELFQDGSVVAEQGVSAVLSVATTTLTSLPGLFLFLITTVLSSFMLCSRYEAIAAFCAQKVPAAWQRRFQTTVSSLRSALSAWFKAQCRLIGLSFLLLSAGLLLLQTSFPLLAAGLIALIDALPVFGAGTVLLPWSLICFLQGDPRRGVGLLLLYGLVYTLRAVLEPRLVGKQAGVSPLLTLLAVYAGYRFLGVAGMILFPIAAVVLKEFWDRTAPRLHPEAGGASPPENQDSSEKKH